MSDPGSERNQRACGKIHISPVCGQSQTSPESLDTDGARYLMGWKDGSLLQSHKGNPQWAFLDQSLT